MSIALGAHLVKRHRHLGVRFAPQGCCSYIGILHIEHSALQQVSQRYRSLTRLEPPVEFNAADQRFRWSDSVQGHDPRTPLDLGALGPAVIETLGMAD